MKMYEKPVVEVLDDVAEVVCADGSNEAGGNGGNGAENSNLTVCRFGRTEANPGADKCQSCSATNGTKADQGGTFRVEDFKGCVDNKPVKG